MASKEESAAVARFVDEDEDEDDDGDYNEYDDDNDDDDDDDQFDENFTDEEDEEEDEKQNVPFAILNGYLQLNEDGKLLYYGSWRMNTESDNDKDTGKKKRFRLKSRQSFNNNNNNNNESLDLNCPSNQKCRRVMLDGFFVDPKGMKIREHNVDMSFSPLSSDEKSNNKNEAKFEVNGQGVNEFGPFFLNGIYAPNDDTPKSNGESKKVPVYHLEVRKWYDDSQASNKPSSVSRKRPLQEEEEEDDENDGENVGYELAGLYEEACMSVDELKQRYQISQKNNGKNFHDDNGLKKNDFNNNDDSIKRYKRTGLLDDDDDDDDDDGCGF